MQDNRPKAPSVGYVAFYGLLDGLYAMTLSDDIGGLLSEMSLLQDGGSADPATLPMWREFETDAEPSSLLETAARFIDAQNIDSPDFRSLVNLLQSARAESRESLVWKAWLTQLERAEKGEIDVQLRFVD